MSVEDDIAAAMEKIMQVSDLMPSLPAIIYGPNLSVPMGATFTSKVRFNPGRGTTRNRRSKAWRRWRRAALAGELSYPVFVSKPMYHGTFTVDP